MKIRCVPINKQISRVICVLPTIRLFPKSDFYGENSNAFSIELGFIIWHLLITFYND